MRRYDARMPVPRAVSDNDIHRLRNRSVLAACLIGLVLGLLGLGPVAASDRLAGIGSQGAPLSIRFGPDAFDAYPHIFAVVGDDDGWVYAANLEGVLRFDGRDWHRFRMPGDAIARALAVDRSGRLFVGGADNFGTIERDAAGWLVYRDLRDELGLTGDDRGIGIVWQIIALPEGVYVHTESGLLLHASDGQHRRWPLPDGVRSFYSDGHRLLARIAGRGLVQVVDGQVELLPGGERFSDQIVAGVAVVGAGRTPVLVALDGLYRLHGDRIEALAAPPWSDMPGEAPYEAIGLGDGGLAVGTLNGALYRFDAEGRALSRSLPGSGAIMAMFRDRDGGLWLGGERGLQRLSIELPWSHFGSDTGVEGWLYDMEWFGEALWLAGSRGLARLAPGIGSQRIRRQSVVAMEAFDLDVAAERLLVAHRHGLAEVAPDGSGRALLDDDEAFSELLTIAGHPDRRWAIGERSIALLARARDGWQVLARHAIGMLSPWGAVADHDGTLWLGDTRGPPQRWQFDPRDGRLGEQQVLGEAVGFALDDGHGSTIRQIDGVIYAVTGRSVRAWDGHRWQPHSGRPFDLFERPMDMNVLAASDGLYAYDSETAWRRAEGDSDWRPLRFDAPQARGVSAIREGRDGKLRIATWSGLLQRDSRSEPPPPPPTKVVLLEAVQRAGESSDVPHALALKGSSTEPIQVDLGADVRMEFGILATDPGQEFRHRISVDGDAGAWSDWTGERSTLFRIGRPGAYLVQVEGRTRGGRSVLPLRLHLMAPTPWHRSGWVQVAAVSLALAALAWLLHLLIGWRTRRLAQLNQALESRITERTAQLEVANRRLEELATEDALTGVLNRRALDQGLQREWLRATDRGLPLAVCMIDVDHFKRFNDQHGHLEGDRVLREIATFLHEQHDRDRELLARFGGEEFALVLPNHTLAAARSRAERIHHAARARNWPVTLSLGVAARLPSVGDGPEQLVGEADAALYRAKRNGRDRVEVAGA